MFFQCLLVMISVVSTSPSDRSHDPATSEANWFDTRGFPVVWNMPTRRCHHLYGVSLPLERYGITHNPKAHFLGPEISLFYQQRLGLYPYLERSSGAPINGGIPQLADLKGHLSLTQDQLEDTLKDNFSGLAVLDWEAWQPLWTWDFGEKSAYRDMSEAVVRWSHPELLPWEVTAVAKQEFEEASRAFMLETLRMAMDLRPAAYWGFYGYPTCHNTNLNQSGEYTGQCHRGTVQLNDQLAWLWRQSSALYPSIYVPSRVAQHGQTQLMVRHRILETLRVAAKYSEDEGQEPTLVMPYARIAFTHTLDFLNKTYLEKTLGESAALGVDGMIFWGERNFAKSKHQCLKLKAYIDSVLGTYVAQLREGVLYCGKVVCGGHGRCIRRRLHDDHMIPLGDKKPDPKLLSETFRCLCQSGWTGQACEQKRDKTVAK